MNLIGKIKNINASRKAENDSRSVMIKVFNNGYIISLLLFLAGSIGSFCDGVVSSKGLGIAELAAIGLIYPYNKFMECISQIFSSGSQVVIGRKIGKSKFDEVSPTFFTSLVSLVVLGIVSAVLVEVFAATLSKICGASAGDNTLEATSTYLRSLAFGAPAYLLTLYMIPLFQLDGKEKLINISTIVMTIVNVLLNILFLFLRMGIAGIGYSTSISYYIALLILSTHFFEKKKQILLQGKFRFSGICLGPILKEGFPAAFKNITSIVYSIFINNLIAAVGSTVALAAYSAYKTTKFIFLSVTESTINPVRMIQSMLYEEKDAKTLRIMMRRSIMTSLVLSTALSLIIWTLGRPLYSLMVSGAVLDETVTLMNWVAIVFILNTFVCYYLAYFQAIDKKKTVYSISFVLNIVSIPYTYFLAKAYGANGIWISFVIQFVVATIYVFACACFMGRKNKRFVDKLLVLSPASEDHKTLDYHIVSLDEAKTALNDLTKACEENITNKKSCDSACLAFEELVFDILKDEKKSSIDIHVILFKDGKIWMRIKGCRKKRDHGPQSNVESAIKAAKSFVEDIKYSYIFGVDFITVKQESL